GCFEQSSTSNYPNVLILDYLKVSDLSRPEVEKQARRLLESGYQKLTGFECQAPAEAVKRRGYEWVGGVAPPHEALTAYGLLQFRDMARVYPVDAEMLKRTRKYLLDQRDGKGGFRRNPRALDTFGRAPDHITAAFIVWALTEGGREPEVERELAALTKLAETSKDPYFLALVGNSLINQGRAAEGVAVLKPPAAAPPPGGYLDGARASITGSGGRRPPTRATAPAVGGPGDGDP